MAKDPAFLFYSSDFLTGTMFMNNEQVGIYIRLLSAQHQHGGLIDKIAFNTMVGNNDLIRSKFIETDDGFYNERLMKEMVSRSVKSSNLSANAKQRWKNEKQLQSNSNAIASDLQMPIEDVNEDEDESTKVKKKKKEKEPVEIKIRVTERVSLTQTELDTLRTKHGASLTQKFIERLDAYKLSNGKKYKSDFGAIISWVIESVLDKANKGSFPTLQSKPRPIPVMSEELQRQKQQLLESGQYGKS